MTEKLPDSLTSLPATCNDPFDVDPNVYMTFADRIHAFNDRTRELRKIIPTEGNGAYFVAVEEIGHCKDLDCINETMKAAFERLKSEEK